MADKSIILRSVEGAALNATQNDQNLDSLAGVVDAQTGTTYTVLYTDQNKTIELNNASMVCTLSAISTIAAAIQSSKWKVTLKNINATAAEVKNNAADTIDGTDYSSTGISLKQYEAITLQINNAGTGWIIIGDKSETFASIDVNGGAIDNTTVGASSASTGAFTTLTASTSLALATGAIVTGILDEDAMGSDSDTQLATQQSIKAYSDSKISTDPSGTGTLSTGGAVEVFVSAAQTTYSATTTWTAAHGLSGVPQEVYLLWECKTGSGGEGGWSELDVIKGDFYVTATVNWGGTCGADGTNVNGVIAGGGPRIPHKTTGAIFTPTAGKWNLYIVAKYYT